MVSSKKTSESKLNETHIPFELLLPTVIFDVLVWGGVGFSLSFATEAIKASAVVCSVGPVDEKLRG